MKPNPTSNDDRLLRNALLEWSVDAPLPPRFHECVWKRIERAEAVPAPCVTFWTALVKWLAITLPRPAVAAAYLFVMAAAGAAGGWMHARQDAARVSDELGVRYVQTVDPYQAAR